MDVHHHCHHPQFVVYVIGWYVYIYIASYSPIYPYTWDSSDRFGIFKIDPPFCPHWFGTMETRTPYQLIIIIIFQGKKLRVYKPV
jgi:hypothetical protein